MNDHRTSFPVKAALAAVTVYQHTLGYILGGQCRFHPSCSEYARLALLRHGFARGSAKTCRRILRCHPFNPGGVDYP